MCLKCDKETCRFCSESDIKTINRYSYCDKCKTIVINSCESTDSIKKEITEHLDKVNNLLLSDMEILNDLQQKYFSEKELTKQENELYEFADNFQRIRKELEFLLQRKFNLSNKRIRELLYKLLILTEQSKLISGGKYHV